MRTRTKKSQQQGQAIDLTPMLDVVFIMLIFFIVTASFIKTPGVEVTKVDAITGESYKKVGILAAVTETNEIWIKKLDSKKFWLIKPMKLGVNYTI